MFRGPLKRGKKKKKKSIPHTSVWGIDLSPSSSHRSGTSRQTAGRWGIPDADHTQGLAAESRRHLTVFTNYINMARPAIVSSLVFVRLSVLLSWYLVACALTDTKVSQLFVKQTLCPGKVVSLDQCPVSGSAGVVGGCSLQCAKRSDCLSFLWDRVQHVCHLCTRIVSNDCVTNTQDQMGLEAYEKVRHTLSAATTNKVSA